MVLQEVEAETSKLALEVEHFELESLLCGEMDAANALRVHSPWSGGHGVAGLGAYVTAHVHPLG